MNGNAEHDFIRGFVKERAAIVLDANKGYLIDARLRSVCREHALADLGALVRALKGRPPDGLVQHIVEALTTNETSFYRDRSYYDALEEHVLPELMTLRRKERRLHLWSAAASTGQEAYSLAMMLADHPELQRWKSRIHATDIDETVLAQARQGKYSDHAVSRGLPASKRARYFEKDGEKWRVRDSIRETVHFAQLNLAGPWPSLEPMDLILLRNVLIYFDVETKKNILERIHRTLRPGGYLLLGGSETTINLTDAFEQVRLGRAVVYRAAAKGA